MKTIKIASGYYAFEYKGREVFITKIEGQNNWYYQIGSDGSVDDWFSSKAIAVEAAVEWIDLNIKK